MHQEENVQKFVNLFALVFLGRLFYVCIKNKAENTLYKACYDINSCTSLRTARSNKIKIIFTVYSLD